MFLSIIGGGVDYGSGDTKLNITFPAGVTCSSFDVPIIDDELSESNETFDIAIVKESLPYGVVFGDTERTTVTIADNDG